MQGQYAHSTGLNTWFHYRPKLMTELYDITEIMCSVSVIQSLAQSGVLCATEIDGHARAAVKLMGGRIAPHFCPGVTSEL
jgi:hypothetical protein